MTPPEGFRRSWFDWFACPSCSHRAFSCYWTAGVSADRRNVGVLYWCEVCGRYCTLERQWLMPVIALGVVGPVLFALAFWAAPSGANSGIGEWLLTIGGLLACGHAAFVLIGCFVKRFVAQPTA